MSLRPDEQQPGEAQTHFAWFRAFLELGPSRSMRQAYKNFTSRKSPKVAESRHQTGENVSASWRAAAIKWQWQARAAQFDFDESERRIEATRARESVIVDRVFKGLERSITIVERADYVSEMVLKSPLYDATTEDGKTTFVPTDWNINTGLRALLAAATARRSTAQLLEQLDKFRSRRAAREMLAALPEPDADRAQTTAERREQQNELLDKLTAVAMTEALAGVDGATERALHILARSSRLNGLDAPFDPADVEKPKQRRDLSALESWELELLETLTDKIDEQEAD